MLTLTSAALDFQFNELKYTALFAADEGRFNKISGEKIHTEKVSCEVTCRRTIINIDERFLKVLMW